MIRTLLLSTVNVGARHRKDMAAWDPHEPAAIEGSAVMRHARTRGRRGAYHHHNQPKEEVNEQRHQA